MIEFWLFFIKFFFSRSETHLTYFWKLLNINKFRFISISNKTDLFYPCFPFYSFFVLYSVCNFFRLITIFVYYFHLYSFYVSISYFLFLFYPAFWSLIVNLILYLSLVAFFMFFVVNKNKKISRLIFSFFFKFLKRFFATLSESLIKVITISFLNYYSIFLWIILYQDQYYY